MQDLTIEDKIDQWHAGKGKNKKLYEFLGMSWERYRDWAEGKTMQVVARRVGYIGEVISIVEQEEKISVSSLKEAQKVGNEKFGKYQDGKFNLVMIWGENNEPIETWRS